jgi:tellurite resistance protein
VLAWAIIAPLALRRLARVAAPPPPMRAATWILLSPPSVAVVAADRLDPGGPLAPLFYVAAVVTLLGLLAFVGWMTAGGWSPGWGAFAFPSTAFAGATLTMAETRLGWAWDAAAALALTLATLLTLWLAWRAAEAWAKGRLAPR